jgi:hypothetical protein
MNFCKINKVVTLLMEMLLQPSCELGFKTQQRLN